MKSVYAATAALVILFAPRGAAAQQPSFFISPFVDTTLTSPSGSGGSSKAGFGVSFGTVGRIIGAETEITYHPQIIDNDANALAKSHVLTFAENILIGPTIGRVKPYGTIGGGDLHLNFTSLSSVAGTTPESISNNYFTLDYGGGVAYFFNKHVGARGDLRYYRAYGLNFDELESSGGLKFNKFDFWRASIGAEFTF
jgi:opacity protein-like surface antigen